MNKALGIIFIVLLGLALFSCASKPAALNCQIIDEKGNVINSYSFQIDYKSSEAIDPHVEEQLDFITAFTPLPSCFNDSEKYCLRPVIEFLDHISFFGFSM